MSFIAGRCNDVIGEYDRNDDQGGPQSPERPTLRAAALGHLGQFMEANNHLQEFLRTRPGFPTAQIPQLRGMQSDAELERLKEVLRKADLPE